jgi:ubiquinone/menaquinone biosynthesis C-methylase UbiE
MKELYEYASTVEWLRKIVLPIGEVRATALASRIIPHLKEDDSIADIGAGICQISNELIKNGFFVTPVDILNVSPYPDVQPVVFDGKTLPFADNQFDVSLLITVLHHIPNPVAALEEALRVSKRVIIIEDVYKGLIQKYATFVMDSVVNFEYIGHPHTNKSSQEWLEVFDQHNLRVLAHEETPFWKYFQHALFHVEKK